MTPKKRIHAHSRRLLAAATALCLVLGCTAPALAAEPIGDGVAPTYDEAYYATVDYYGNLTNGSVVKSYILNGADTLTDYGTYDEVVNLTDGTEPSVKNGITTFRFDGGDTPSHFYFEGKTAVPFETLPWTISIHYALNGVPTKAEDLAGKTGVVEIFLDIVPNGSASQYAKNNYTLEAMAIFNQDDILSLEAPGAQVQLIGNLRAVLFLALPGEEQHFSIRVGAEDFSFGGMTFLMVPATLSQLEQIAELSDRKDELEEDYETLMDSLDVLLDSMNDMSGSLYASANGLDELNRARGTISAGKGQVYHDTDVLRGDLDSIVEVLEPVSGEMDAASQAITDSKTVLQTLTETVTSLRSQLENLEDTIDDLQDDGENARDLLDDLEDMEEDLGDLRSVLQVLSRSDLVSQVEDPFGGMSKAEVQEGLKVVKPLYSRYQSIPNPDISFSEFVYDYIIDQAYQQFLEALAAQQGAGEEASDEDGSEVETAEANTSGEEPSDETAQDAGTISEVLSAALTFRAPEDGDTEDGDEPEAPSLPSKEEFLATSYGAAAQEKAEAAAQLASAYAADPEGVELLVEHYDTVQSLIKSFNTTVGKVNSTLRGLAKPTASLVGKLEDLCGETDDLEDLLDHMDDLGDIGQATASKCRDILDSVQDLYDVLDTYEPEAQKALATVKDLSVTASRTVQDTGTFFDSFENLLKTSGVQLDQGTKDTLSGLAAALRSAANSLNKTEDVKNAKRSIDDIVRDTWNEHTGEVDNLLNMDVTARAESLTSSQNPAPTSIQVVIRSQEIKVEEPEETEAEKQAADNGTFWSRVAQMFKDFWAAITGIFR